MEEPPISALMRKDPLQLTREDRSVIIAYYRENRTKFVTQGNKTAGKPAKGPKEKLTSLDLDI
jgi:hypothetical protein